MDIYQERYLNHQERKTKSLDNFNGDDFNKRSKEEFGIFYDILKERRSQRVFNNKELTPTELHWIFEAIRFTPSSCNRQAVYVRSVDPNTAERFLVGGKNWIKNANKVILLFANKLAYKSPNEKGFMPYLDAGFVGQSIYLMAESINIGACFVNPNIREDDKAEFIEMFGDDYFCGAVAIGNYNKKSKRPPLREKVF